MAQAQSRRSYGKRLAVRSPGRSWSRDLVRRLAGGGTRVKRKIGPKRPSGSRQGLTRAQAERELRRRMDTERQLRVRAGDGRGSLATV